MTACFFMRHKGFFLQPSFLIGTAQEKLNNPSGQTVQENYLNPIPSKINTLNEEIKKLEEFIQGINNIDKKSKQKILSSIDEFKKKINQLGTDVFVAEKFNPLSDSIDKEKEQINNAPN